MPPKYLGKWARYWEKILPNDGTLDGGVVWKSRRRFAQVCFAAALAEGRQQVLRRAPVLLQVRHSAGRVTLSRTPLQVRHF
jgi:hypothetical protein